MDMINFMLDSFFVLQRLWPKKYARVEQQLMPQMLMLQLAPLIMSQVLLMQKMDELSRLPSFLLYPYTSMFVSAVCAAYPQVLSIQPAVAAFICTGWPQLWCSKQLPLDKQDCFCVALAHHNLKSRCSL